ncbi:hypothetical protein FH972_019266 [Carpinus fangiana]|uniref:Senescence domain-containing protein n=1 Tax=Carpinus fangiana TaxID=176857 RepID=A0A5N6RQ26_9ROSI|nr:hypothetical protein FH972_019266 [Carpinus fangiana]
MGTEKENIGEDLEGVVGGNDEAAFVGVAGESSELTQRGEARTKRAGISGDGLGEQRANKSLVGGLFGSGDSLNAERAVGDAPVLDEAAERGTNERRGCGCRETIIHYVGEKAVGAKDSTLETGKHVVEHAEKAAVGLKDKATMAGCTAAHYSCKKAVEGTKAVASAVKGAAEYAGHKAAEIVSKPLSTTKDVATSTGESAKEYTGRNLLDSLYHNKKILNHNYDLLGVGVGGQIQGLLGVCVQEEKMAGALLWVAEAESLMVMKMV